jgi:hypothetical protein
MSKVIALNHDKNNSRRFQRTPEGKYTEEDREPLLGGASRRSASLWAPLSASCFERQFSTALGFASTPSFQVSLIRELRMDVTAYIYQPLPPPLSIKP